MCGQVGDAHIESQVSYALLNTVRNPRLPVLPETPVVPFEALLVIFRDHYATLTL